MCLPFSYYLITLLRYLITLLNHSLLMYLLHDYVLCKRFIRYYLVTLLHGSLQMCLPFSIRCNKSMFFFYTSRYYGPFFHFLLILYFIFFRKIHWTHILLCYLIVLGHFYSHPLVVLSRDLEISNGMCKQKNHTRPVNTLKALG